MICTICTVFNWQVKEDVVPQVGGEVLPRALWISGVDVDRGLHGRSGLHGERSRQEAVE